MDGSALSAVRFMDGIDLIAVTGGPCGGKDTIMAQERQRLETLGFNVRVIRETATDLIAGGFSPMPAQWPASDALAFQRHVLLHQLEKEQRYISMLRDQQFSGRTVVLINRGATEGVAYAQPEEFSAMLKTVGLNFRDLLLRYKGAVHMVTAADGAEAYYTTSNNEARRESPEEARRQDKLTQQAWHGHPHFHVIDNHASGGFAAKCHRAHVAIARMLNMPEPLEKEHWFALRNFNAAMIPSSAVQTQIAQRYLHSRGGFGRRVRKCTHGGVDTFFYTEKKETGRPGERIEREREIHYDEYLRLLKDLNPALREIRKVRHSFTYANRHLELDEFLWPVRNFFKLEIEVSDLSEPVELPPGWEATNVTADNRYSNYGIASDLLPAEAYV